jgi:hypothetical protein
MCSPCCTAVYGCRQEAAEAAAEAARKKNMAEDPSVAPSLTDLGLKV